MMNQLAGTLLSAGVWLACGAALNAQAQSAESDLSAVSALPVASVLEGASMAASAVATVPLALSRTGATLVVDTVR